MNKYLIIGLGNKNIDMINYHNYQLTKRIDSSGFRNLIGQPDKIDDFINGNIIYAPYVPNLCAFVSPSTHSLKVTNDYHVEYTLEYIRDKYFPTYPSRFSCIYAFGDYETCIKANKLYPKMFDLNKIKKFKLIYTGTDFDKCIKVVKCNMQIVTKMWNSEIITFESDSVDQVAKAYWTGIGNVMLEKKNIYDGLIMQEQSDLLYEYLIEGILEEVN